MTRAAQRFDLMGLLSPSNSGPSANHLCVRRPRRRCLSARFPAFSLHACVVRQVGGTPANVFRRFKRVQTSSLGTEPAPKELLKQLEIARQKRSTSTPPREDGEAHTSVAAATAGAPSGKLARTRQRHVEGEAHMVSVVMPTSGGLPSGATAAAGPESKDLGVSIGGGVPPARGARTTTPQTKLQLPVVELVIPSCSAPSTQVRSGQHIFV